MPTKDPTYNPWWAKVVFTEFCGHYFGMSREQIADDVTESIKALLEHDPSGSSFGAKMVQIAQERIEKHREERGVHGDKGGRPRKYSEDDAAVAVKRPDQLVYGKFENVFLTQDDFNDFCVRVGNVNEAHDLIESLSGAMADGTKKSSNHLATLLGWLDYRRKHPNEKAYENYGERSMRIYRESRERLNSMDERELAYGKGNH